MLADMIGQCPGCGYGNRSVAAADDRYDTCGENFACRIVDTLARQRGIHFRHLDVAAIGAAAVEIDLILEPVRKVFLRRQTKLPRSFIGSGFADIAFVERCTDKGVANARGTQLLPVERDVIRAHERDLSGCPVVDSVITSLG